MATNFNPTLKRVLRELQALRARIDQQITVMRQVIQLTASLKARVKKRRRRPLAQPRWVMRGIVKAC